MTDGRPDPEDAQASIRTLLFMYKSILDFGNADISIRITQAAAHNFDLPARSVCSSFLAQDLSRRRMLKTIAMLRECYGTRAAASMSPAQRRRADEIDQLLERFQRSVRPAVSWWKLALPTALISTFIFRLLSIRSERDRPAYEALVDSVAASLRLDYQTAFDPATPITARAAFQLVFTLLVSLLIAVAPFMWRNYPHYRALFLVDWASDKKVLNHERCTAALEHRASAAVGRSAPAWWDFQIDLVLKFAVVTTAFAILLYSWAGLGEISLADRPAFAGHIALIVGPFWWWYVVRLSQRIAARRDNQPIRLPRFLASLSHSRSLLGWCVMAFVLFLTSDVLHGRASIFDAIGELAICVTWVFVLQCAAWIADVGWRRVHAWFQRA